MAQWFEYNEQVVTEGVRQYRYGHQRSVSLACTKYILEKRLIKSNVPLRKEDYTQTAISQKNGGTKHCNVLFKWCTMERHVSISLATHTLSIRMYSSIVCLTILWFLLEICEIGGRKMPCYIQTKITVSPACEDNKEPPYTFRALIAMAIITHQKLLPRSQTRLLPPDGSLRITSLDIMWKVFVTMHKRQNTHLSCGI